MRKTILLLVVALFGLTQATSAEDWPQWRGPNRDGISKEKGLLQEWPTEGPTLVWQKNELGDGYSTPGNRQRPNLPDQQSGTSRTSTFRRSLSKTARHSGVRVSARSANRTKGRRTQAPARLPRSMAISSTRLARMATSFASMPRRAKSAGGRISSPISAASPAPGPTLSRRSSTATCSSSRPAAKKRRCWHSIRTTAK